MVEGSDPAPGSGTDTQPPTEQAWPSGVDPLGARLGIRFSEASPQRVVATMPVEGNTQPFGLLHGGASCVLAEALGSVGASMHAAAAFGGYAVGIDISAT